MVFELEPIITDKAMSKVINDRFYSNRHLEENDEKMV